MKKKVKYVVCRTTSCGTSFGWEMVGPTISVYSKYDRWWKAALKVFLLNLTIVQFKTKYYVDRRSYD